MREIKFRAWDRELEEWTNYSISNINGNIIDFYNKEAGFWESDREGERFILCQYTGLKDKTGKEIYEGDIVREIGDDYTPVYTKGIYMALNIEQLKYPEEHRQFSTQFNVVWKNGCEILGNIYENPELLKELANDN